MVQMQVRGQGEEQGGGGDRGGEIGGRWPGMHLNTAGSSEGGSGWRGGGEGERGEEGQD